VGNHHELILAETRVTAVVRNIIMRKMMQCSHITRMWQITALHINQRPQPLS